MTSTFITVCIGLMTLGIWIGLFFFIYTLLQLKRTAQSIEVLTYKMDDSFSKLQGAAGYLSEFAEKVRSGWMRALELAIGSAMTLWSHRSGPEKRGHHKSEND